MSLELQLHLDTDRIAKIQVFVQETSFGPRQLSESLSQVMLRHSHRQRYLLPRHPSIAIFQLRYSVVLRLQSTSFTTHRITGVFHFM